LLALAEFLDFQTPSPRIGDLYLMSQARLFERLFASLFHLLFQSLRASRIALAAVIDAAAAVWQRSAKNGLALVRPPGHHADCSHSRGFCVFNNVGAAARMLVSRGAKRILIVDWDVHHGDGTESMFYSDPTVLCVSIHRYDNGSFYPRSGHSTRCGDGAGMGYNINIALNGTGYGDSDYMMIFDQIIMPVGNAFCPDVVLVSCGFDAGRGDPLGEFDVTAFGYARMTKRLLSLADGK
jgi:acetoin utilization deacetylase AcuC-like enzyme